MKVSFDDLMRRLGVDGKLGGYETQPWQITDPANGQSYSAEVRVMDGDCQEIEAEISVSTFKNENDEEAETDLIMSLEAVLDRNKKYGIKRCSFEGKDFANSVSGWEDKIFRFFKGVVTEIKANKVPDIEEIKKKAMDTKGRTGGKGGSSDARNPKIKGSQLVQDMKKGGMGF